jgi:hypothetical protein
MGFDESGKHHLSPAGNGIGGSHFWADLDDAAVVAADSDGSTVHVAKV